MSIKPPNRQQRRAAERRSATRVIRKQWVNPKDIGGAKCIVDVCPEVRVPYKGSPNDGWLNLVAYRGEVEPFARVIDLPMLLDSAMCPKCAASFIAQTTIGPLLPLLQGEVEGSA